MALSMSKRALRMERRHEKAGPAHLNIVSLMDIFTLLVFFLLANSNDVEVLPSASIIHVGCTCCRTATSWSPKRTLRRDRTTTRASKVF